MNDIIRYYTVEKRLVPEDGRLMTHETIVCAGSEIECRARIKELQKLQSEHRNDDVTEAEATGSMIQFEPEYTVALADEYDKEHSINEQRNIMDKLMKEFGVMR